MTRGLRRRLWWSAIGCAVLVGLGISLAIGLAGPAGDEAGQDGSVARAEVLDAPAPVLSGPTLAGGEFDLADWHGDVVLVNVWASWCGPCRDELALLAEASARWRDQGFRVVGLNVRDGERPARELLAELGADDLTTVSDPKGTLAVSWGVRGVPETFIVDRDGRIRLHAMGPVDARWLDQHVPALLEAP